MKTKANILIEDGQNIKVASVDTPIIKANTAYIPNIKVNATVGYNAILYDDVNNILNIGDYEIIETTIRGSYIRLSTEDYGEVNITDEGFVIDVDAGVRIDRGGLQLANYTTALRPTPKGEGDIIYDSTLKKCILYNGTAWVNLDGTALS